MRKTALLSIIATLFITAACTNDDNLSNSDDEPSANVEKENSIGDHTNNDQQAENNVESADDETGTIDEAQNQDDMKMMMTQLDFYEIEIEVTYAGSKEFEIEIDHYKNGDIDAEVEDELNGVKVKDDVEAFNYIFPKLKTLNVTKEMEKQAVIDEVLQAFDLDANFEKIEVEIEFNDGVKLSFEDRK